MKTTIEPLEDGNTRIRIPIEFRYDNGRKRIFFPEMPDEHLKINEPLATGIARAYRWQELLDKGEYDSPEALAEALGVHTSYVRRFLRLALLVPPIVDAIFAGKPHGHYRSPNSTPPCPIRGKSKWNFSECCKNKLR